MKMTAVTRHGDAGWTIDNRMAVFPLASFPNGLPAIIAIDNEWYRTCTAKEYWASRERNALAWELHLKKVPAKIR